MASRLHWAVYGTSVAAHLGIAFAVERVDAPPPLPPKPITITVRELPPEPAPPPPEPPKPVEPEVADVEPVDAPPVAAPEPAAPPPPAPAPRPRAPKPSTPPAAAPTPSFGMSGGSTGTAVPAGDPSGTPGGTGEHDDTPKRTVKRSKVLESAPPKAASDGCTEADVKPRPISMPQPAYTDAARAAGIAGKVRVEVSVDASGKVTGAKVIGPLDPGLDAAALQAIESAKFEPATRCGKPVAATFKIAVKFSL